MDRVDRTEEFQLVAQLRKSVANVATGIRPATAIEYEKIYARMLRDQEAPDDATSRSGYFLRRAALIYVCANQARKALRKRDQATFGSDAWEAVMQEIERVSEVFRRYPPDPDRQHHSKGSNGRCWKDVRADKESAGWQSKSKSKRVGLGSLLKHPNWANDLLEHITPAYRPAFAITFLTGARPAELEHGVTIRPTTDGLEITIQGAKIGVKRGQPVRTLLVSTESKAAQYLVAIANGGDITVIANAKRFCDTVRKAGKKAYPRMRASVSPYSLRHAVASSLKASGIDADGIAQVLGHRASRSQQAYGLACHSRNNTTSIRGVRASLPVKDTGRSPTAICGVSGAPKFG